MKRYLLLSLILGMSAMTASAAEVLGEGAGTTTGCSYSYSIEKVGPMFIHEGTDITYTLFVKNLGTCDLKDLTVRDIFPERFKFISASNGYVQHDDVVVWKDVKIVAGDGAVFTVTFEIEHAKAGTTFTNWGCVQAKHMSQVCDSAVTTIEE